MRAPRKINYQSEGMPRDALGLHLAFSVSIRSLGEPADSSSSSWESINPETDADGWAAAAAAANALQDGVVVDLSFKDATVSRKESRMIGLRDN